MRKNANGENRNDNNVDTLTRGLKLMLLEMEKYKTRLLTNVSKNTALQTHTELPTNSTNIITENAFWISFTYLKMNTN